MLNNKKNLLTLFGLNLILSNFLIVFRLNPFFINTFISFFTYLVIPGLLFVFALGLNELSFWKKLFIAIGFSVFFLETGGFLINLILPVVGIKAPLTTLPVVLGIDVLMVPLFWFTYFKAEGASIVMPKISATKQNIALYGIPLLFPLLAALGAISINNGGSNVLTMVLLALIAVYSFTLIALHKRVKIDIYPYSIFFIALSLLFTTSLRSWYVSGHDILIEYYVFKLTNVHNLWSVDFYKDAYNACLSITILPTILTRLLLIKDMYIFKFIFQVIFAICPVIIFYLLYRYTTRVFAFISVLFFVSFPTFYNDMPMLNRQEIAFIFFGLLLYVILSSEIPLKARKLMFFIFGIGLILSHYSTNYIFLVSVVCLYSFYLLAKIPRVRQIATNFFGKFKIDISSKFVNSSFITLSMVIFMFAATLLWTKAITNTSNNIGTVTNKVINSLLLFSNNSARSNDLSYSLLFGPKRTPEQILNKYIGDTIESAKKKNEGAFYSESESTKYTTYSLPQETQPMFKLGKLISSLGIQVFTLNSLTRQLSAGFMQLAVFIGILGIIFFYKSKKIFEFQYFVLAFASIGMLILIVVLPEISVEYGLLRLFAQSLFLLSLPIVVALSILFGFLGEKKIYLIGLVAVLFLLTLTGFFSNLTGGYYPQMTLNNDGLYYDAYYMHKADVVSAEWLKANKHDDLPVQSDLSGKSKLLANSGIFSLDEIVPQSIRRNSYVYLTTTNSEHAIVLIDANTIIFNSPVGFLYENKDLIYDNGSNQIYR
ncbi:MAG TPA: DUF2206 domain-containing protein [Patescibacteria group bacterium]|nr:DUF2206 domain-containing protein [Patescibacteria group bacterium]